MGTEIGNNSIKHGCPCVQQKKTFTTDAQIHFFANKALEIKLPKNVDKCEFSFPVALTLTALKETITHLLYLQFTCGVLLNSN